MSNTAQRVSKDGIPKPGRRDAGGAADPDAAWASYVPDARWPWTAALAGHLLRRAAFGSSAAQLHAALDTGPQAAVADLLRPAADITEFNREHDAFETSGTSALPLDELSGWWLRRMMKTPHPLLETMTLFWHGFFGIGADSPGLALAYVRTLRTHALGRFDGLLTAVLRDPASQLAAGGAQNYKARPNDAFARRVLSCFAVGDGAFSPRDVAETARALTGEFVRGGVPRSVPREHDGGDKTIFGCTGPWTAADLPGLALRHPATARRVVRALYRQFVSEADDPGDGMIDPLVRDFGRDFDIGRLVGTILRSNAFYAPAAIRRRVKSPVDLVVGLSRALEAVAPTLPLGRDLADLGQDLYRPPALKGWAGGRVWIDPATMIGRANLAAAVLAGSGPYAPGLHSAAALRTASDAPDAALAIERLLLPDGASPGLRPTLAAWAPDGVRALAGLIAASPEYQLA